MTGPPLSGGLDPSLTSRYEKDVFFPLSFPNTILKNLLHQFAIFKNKFG